MRTRTFTRRQLQGAALSPRRPPREELVNTLEFEEVAKMVLPAAVYSTIAGGDRRAFDRIIFRPRMLVPTTDLDLSLDLFGQPHFAPILVGPVADQRRYHPEGELATRARRRGRQGGHHRQQPGERADRRHRRSGEDAALVFGLYRRRRWRSEADSASHRRRMQRSVSSRPPRTRIDWKAIEQIRRGVTIPVVIKGIMTTGDAKTAIEQGARGIVISDHGAATGKGAAIDVLPGSRISSAARRPS